MILTRLTADFLQIVTGFQHRRAIERPILLVLREICQPDSGVKVRNERPNAQECSAFHLHLRRPPYLI
ncbi:MAG: hypothetical protein QOE77_1095 [Blastocatellia bacterium]|nr:hypothetical protein [Blastocatellia bacterium]